MSNFWGRQGMKPINEYKRSLGALVGIAQGFTCDGHVSDDEIRFLKNWLEANEELKFTWPGDVLFARVEQILADGVVTEDERQYMVETLEQLVGGSPEDMAKAQLATKLGYDTITILQYPGNNFCVTGDFVFGPRESCHNAITVRGGAVSGGVTKKLHCLIVGSLGSAEWKHGSWGTKVEKARKYKKDGCPILIINEESWTNSFQSVAHQTSR